MRVRTIRSIARRFLMASLILITVVSVASAYTVVFKGGRRVEIPSNFMVTQKTLTYEVQPGIQVTLQIAAIDVSATEKANNEKPGAFAGRAQITNAQVASRLSAPKTSTKTITNNDLEAASKRRIASEAAYEKRLKDLGLPSTAETRRQAETSSAIAQAEIHNRLAAERQTENYWRTRADEMRTEITALDAEIRFVRIKLEETPFLVGGGSFTSVTSLGTGISFNGGGGRGHFGGHRSKRTGVYSARVGVAPQAAGRVGFGGGATRGRVLVNPGFGRRGHFGSGTQWGPWNQGHILFGSSIGIWPNTAWFGSAYDNSWERSELITRFNDLSATRAGLSARWSELEDEARRAGVPPGWLRR